MKSGMMSMMKVAVLAAAAVALVARPAVASDVVVLPGGVSLEMLRIPGVEWSMGQYEVTQAQWEAVMGGNSSHFKGADRPVENVSWYDCQEFVKKLNALPAVQESGVTYRLPTEEEWEYACRAGSTGDYCKLADGTEITEGTLERVAWYRGNSGRESHPVGQKEPNAWGLYDMHGNVWEWTATDAGGPRVLRSGAWNRKADDCTADTRRGNDPVNRSYNLGFRLVAED